MDVCNQSCRGGNRKPFLCMVGKGAQAYVETQLVKTLKPGDIVILDNLGPA